MAAGDVTVRREPRVQQLAVPLTEDELQIKAKTLAATVKELSSLRDKHKGVKAELKGAEKVKEAELEELARIVTSGEEYRPVNVYDEANGELGTVETIRVDTGKVVFTRPMTTTEREAYRQGRLFAQDEGGERVAMEPGLPAAPPSAPLPPGLSDLAGEVDGKVTKLRPGKAG